MSNPITVIFINDPYISAWKGYEENGVLRFDWTNKRGHRRFFVMPEKCVMFADESHLPVCNIRPGWYVHVVDTVRCESHPTIWVVYDREIDVLVSSDSPEYSVLDLDDFGQALSEGQISVTDAARLLTATQHFLDTHLHTGDFPPAEVRPWLVTDFNPQPIPFDTLPEILQVLNPNRI